MLTIKKTCIARVFLAQVVCEFLSDSFLLVLLSFAECDCLYGEGRMTSPLLYSNQYGLSSSKNHLKTSI